MNKNSIYQNILDNYNISSNFDFIDNPYSEKSIMTLITSKFMTDTTYNNNHKKIIDFILKDNNINSYADNNFIDNTYYYENNIIINKDKNPIDNILIIDYDISHYSTNNIKNYLIYLDIISQIYLETYNVKNNLGAHNVKNNLGAHKQINSLTINCRYDARKTTLNKIIIFHTNKFNFIIDIIRQDQYDNYIVSDINIKNSNDHLNNIIISFKDDIIKHLNYLSGNDIDSTNKKYLENISYYYKLCRIKLMYSINQAIFLLSLKSSNRINKQKTIVQYIKNNILPVFTNFKETINYLNNDELVSEKKLLYATNVIKDTNRIQKINNKLLNHKDTLVKNKNKKNGLNNVYSDLSILKNLSIIVLIIVCILSFIIISSNIYNNEKGFIFSVMIYVLIALYIMIYFYLSFKPNVEEQFENDNILFPRIKVNANNFAYDNGIIVRINSSNNDVNAYKIFDRNNNSSVNIQNTKNNYRNDYSGEYVKIDLGEYVILNNYSIKGNGKDVRLYGSNDNIAWMNVNHESWIVIDERINISENNNFINSQIPYRYYMIIINKIYKNSSDLNIKSLNLYGKTYLKTISLISDNIDNIVSTENKWKTHILPEVILPYDYDDIGLVSWDASVFGYKENGLDVFYGCLWTNILGICLPSIRPHDSISKNVNNLNIPFKNKKISAYLDIWGHQIIRDFYYQFTIRYYPSVSKDERINILNTIENNLEKKLIAETLYRIYKNEYNKILINVNNINKNLKQLEGQQSNDNDIVLEHNYKTLIQNKELIMNSLNLVDLDLLSVQKIIELASKNIDTEKMTNDYTSTANKLQNDIISRNNLKKLNNQIKDLINNYLKNSDEAQQKMIDYYYSEYQYNNGKNEATKLQQQQSQILAEKANINEEISRNKAEDVLRDLDNNRNNVLNNQININNNSPLLSQMINIQNNINKLKDDYEILVQEKQDIDNKLALKLSSDSSELEINNINLQSKIISEKIITLNSNIEFNIEKLEKIKESIINTNINAIITINNNIITDIKNNMNFFKNIKSNIESKNIAISSQLSFIKNKKQIKNNERLFEMKHQEFKLNKNNFILRYINLCIEREEKANIAFSSLNNRDKLKSNIIIQIESIIKQLVDSREINNSNSKIPQILKETDSLLLNNMNIYINEINYDLVLPSLKNEYNSINETEKNYNMLSQQSIRDINVNKIYIYETRLKIHLYLLLSLVVVITMTVWYYVTPRIAIITCLILFIIIVIIHYINIVKIVRTKSRNKYWIKPYVSNNIT